MKRISVKHLGVMTVGLLLFAGNAWAAICAKPDACGSHQASSWSVDQGKFVCVNLPSLKCTTEEIRYAGGGLYIRTSNGAETARHDFGTKPDLRMRVGCPASNIVLNGGGNCNNDKAINDSTPYNNLTQIMGTFGTAHDQYTVGDPSGSVTGWEIICAGNTKVFYVRATCCTL